MSNWRQVDDILHHGLTQRRLYCRRLPGRPVRGGCCMTRPVGRLSLIRTAPPPPWKRFLTSPPSPKLWPQLWPWSFSSSRGACPCRLTWASSCPWLPDDKKCLSLVYLLTHQSGLPAWQPFYETVLTLPAAERPRRPGEAGRGRAPGTYPGKLTIYSDLGFMLLKAVVESVAGEDLHTFCRRHLSTSGPDKPRLQTQGNPLLVLSLQRRGLG